MPPARKNKIVATIGPATCNPDANPRIEVVRTGE